MKTKLSLTISAALISSVAVANSQYTANPYAPEIISAESYKKPTASKSSHIAQQRFIIELNSPAVAKYQGGIESMAATAPKKGQKVNVQSAPAQSYASFLAKEQSLFVNELAKKVPNAKVEQSFKTLFNGVTVVGQGLSLEQLVTMPNVKSVYPEAIYEVNMDSSHDVINSEAMWKAVSGMENAGEGIRVAVIDTGIRPENPMFTGDGFTKPVKGMPNDDYCSTVDANFCNDKLIVARWSQPTFNVCPDEYMSPLGYGGHGSHVAGTSVGNKITTTYEGVEVELSGVAPTAYLMVYKALFTNEDCQRGGGSNIMLMEAMEHAVNDGADVINNSWGGSAGGDPANSPYKAMYEAAEAAGVVVVTSAGNSGNGSQTIGCPGCIESGITVANTTTGRFFANSLTVNGEEILALQSNNGQLETDITAPIIAAANIDADNMRGCEAFAADSFKDGIALISRGLCSFATKADNAEAAGAKAMVVYNDAPSAPVSMYMPDSPLPAVMISEADGATILEGLSNDTSGTIAAKVTRIVNSKFADILNGSSSRGPNGNQNILKPDLAAPGTLILSATSPDADDTNFTTMSGTSMASPHVAGAAALMRQLHPNWSANDIKTALTSTAHMDGVLDDNTVTPADPFAMGAGRIDLDAAAKAVLTFDKPSIASDSCVGPCTFTRTVYNKSDETTTWDLSVLSDSTAISISPSSLKLEAGESATFAVTVDATYSEYGAWIFGNVMLKSVSHQDAHLPMAILAKESSDASLISTMATKADLTADENMPIKAVVNNTIFENTVTVTAMAPKGTKLTSANDVTATLNGASQHGLEVNEALGRITWVGNIELPKIQAVKSTGASPSIFDLGLAHVPACKSGCNEESFTFNLPAFKYNGVTYTRLTISDNGLVIVGGGSALGLHNNQKLPNSDNPNNILAPLWSDYDLSDGTVGDTGGGQLGINIVAAGGNEWIVVEWKDAQLYADTSGNQYSFSIWIQTGDLEDIRFNYLNIPNMLPSNVTIGAEDINGIIGTTYYHNGQGDTVTTGDSITFKATPSGRVEIDYLATPTSFAPGQIDDFIVDEEDTLKANVLDNDTATKKVARVSITGDGMTANAQRIIDVAPAGALGEATIVDEPAHGKVTLEKDGTMTYTPEDDFFGNDSFTYTSKDALGNLSEATTVNVKVNNVNDAPTVAPSGMTSTEGFAVIAKANGKDVDGDSLTYTWVQTSGTPVTFNNGGEEIRFVAPAGDHTLTFSVVANDGELESEADIATIIVNAKKESSSGGSLGWFVMLMLTFAALRHRK